MTSRLTSKGQVTIPKPVRDYLHLRAGSAVGFERLPSGEIVVRAAGPQPKKPGRTFASLRGRATVRMSTDEIMALTRGGARR